MSHAIVVRGARENNLKDVSVDIPKQAITVFTGVSGSGKSSLVFDTIAAEAQRQLNETFTAFVQGFLPSYGRPDVELIDHLSAPVIVDQRRIGGNARSTVGTFTDIAPILRLLFSRVGEPHAGYANTFSFNDPQGMCPECEGLGRTTQVDLGAFVDMSRSLNEGAVLPPDLKVGSWPWKLYANSGLFDPDKRLADYGDDELRMLLHGTGDEKRRIEWAEGFGSNYEGLVERFTRLYIKRDVSALSERSRAAAERFVTSATCPLCHGARLNQAALSSRVGDHNIAELSAMEVRELPALLQTLDVGGARSLVERLVLRLDDLVTIGLGYLSLDRPTASLSGGESQRVKMVRHLSSSLGDMLYIFDEPSVGLHARDVERLNTILLRLRDKGNTVLVVEHDPDVIAVADHVVDMGPGAGAAGGRVVYQGGVDGLHQADTLTGRFMRAGQPPERRPRLPGGSLAVRHARQHNLKDVSVDIPTGVLTVVTGVAGSGKSSLIHGAFLPQQPEAIVMDQSPVRGNIRSTPATYTGMMDEIRKRFAKASGVSPALFSFNSAGACPDCKGLGVIYTDLAFMDGFSSPCDSCRGRRFTDEVLSHKLRGKDISEVLAMTVIEAAAFFSERPIAKVLAAMQEVGLSYLSLGQPLSTLSGGECQRLKLATELHKEGSLYVMDEPTTGLHMSDVGQFLTMVDRLVERGNTVVVIEHNLDVIAHADWIIDLGPGAGHDGGRVVFEGTPQDLMQADGSVTGRFLRRRAD